MVPSNCVCRIARSTDIAAAQGLLNARYASRGYAEHLMPVGPAFTTFVADAGGETIATVTLELRGGAAWLIRLASSGRSAAVLAELFWLAYEHGTAKSDARDVYVHVHPRHIGFYRSAFGFRPLGDVEGAGTGEPSQLMRVGVAGIAKLYEAGAEAA